MRKILLSGTLVCACASWCGAANKFVQHNLVSDLPGVADHLDACLVNPWGIAATATSPFWVSLNGSGLAESTTATAIRTPCLSMCPDPPARRLQAGSAGALRSDRERHPA